MSQLEINFINKICEELLILNGTDFEYFCQKIFGLILGNSIIHKGHNLCAKPVGYTADLNTEDYEIVGQCGTDNDYFEPLEEPKPIKDIKSAIKNHPRTKKIFLFVNQRGSGGKISTLNDKIDSEHFAQKISLIDSEKIANIIFNNIAKVEIIEEILHEYLPLSYEYYKILPQTNRIPDFTSKRYFERKDEEKIVIDGLKKNGFVQIYGISGVGKTEIAKSILNTLKNDYETAIWIDGESTDNIDFYSVHVSRFNSFINLSTLIENYKIIVVFDNYNKNVKSLYENFVSINNNYSICIVTSLQKNIHNDELFYELSFVNDEIAKSILMETDKKPENDQAEKIIKYVGGYPLLLSIIRDLIAEESIFSWNDIIEDINPVSIEDPEKNVKIATRILGKISIGYEEELTWISILKSNSICKEFFEFVISKTGIRCLKSRSLIKHTEPNYYTIHQVILDAILLIFPRDEYIDRPKKHQILEDYLKLENERKSAGYFNFIFLHTEFINTVYHSLSFESSLKKNILYLKVQARDFEKGNWYLEELKSYKMNYNNRIDLLLEIEKIEIELSNFNKTGVKDRYNDICSRYIEHLENIIKNITNENDRRFLNHHLGKLYIQQKEYDNAIKVFKEILKTHPDSDSAKLHLARIYTKYKFEDYKEEFEELIDKVLTQDNHWEKQSLSVLLSIYELIAQNRMQKYRKIYIDDNINSFLENIFYSLLFGFDQPFGLLAKLAGHLGYNMTEQYIEICEKLPLPATINENNELKYDFATINAIYYRLLKYEEINDKEKMDKVYRIAKTYFKSCILNDYQRVKYVDLLIDAENFQEAKEELIKTDDGNPFYFQKLCKIERGLGKTEESLIAIDKAIELNSDKLYFSAFLHDKAITISDKNVSEAISILESALSYEKNERTLKSWNETLAEWKKI
ncbi:hypothetical protein AGMMS50230_06010 [Spirochaetia bacterium]|nr:hypothetical protein AGMMS50230_06010 [Spirochaetia bacterium]